MYKKKKKIIAIIILTNAVLDIELPNEQGRMDILKIHALKITKHGEIGTV